VISTPYSRARTLQDWASLARGILMSHLGYRATDLEDEFRDWIPQRLSA